MLKITGIVVAAAIAVLAGWDTYAQATGGIESTISYWLWSNGAKYPEIPFIAGFLCGHCFWSAAWDLTRGKIVQG